MTYEFCNLSWLHQNNDNTSNAQESTKKHTYPGANFNKAYQYVGVIG